MRVPENDDSRELFDYCVERDILVAMKQRPIFVPRLRNIVTPIVEKLSDEEESPENRKPTYIKLMLQQHIQMEILQQMYFGIRKMKSPQSKKLIHQMMQ